MGDLKTYFSDAVVPTPSLSGDSITASGSDPNADGNPGVAATDPLWPAPFVPTPSGEESRNSVSGLPPLPTRYQPSETPPEPPSLEDRNPGTIDRR
jgi:hypothetical protein